MAIGAVMRRSSYEKKCLVKASLLRVFKELLTLIGARLSNDLLQKLQMVMNYMELGRWMSDNHFEVPHRRRDQYGVWGTVDKQICEKRVLYLEFGVFLGASMRYWSNKLKHPESMLHGFDSFEGLPEDFDVCGPLTKGTFSTDGVPPVIDDKRVKFFKGWFEEVLPGYHVPEHEVLIVNLDADLYSSTIYVLRYLRKWICAGTFIYFDDMSRPEHEPKAFSEFMRESGLQFSLISTDRSLNFALFKCEADGAGHRKAPAPSTTVTAAFRHLFGLPIP